MQNFNSTFEYKLIYIFTIKDEAHKGFLKIGDTTIQTDKSIDELPENCKDLNKAARKRIDYYTSTAGISYELLYTELAVYTKKDEDNKVVLKAFRDYQVHNVLKNSGIKNKKIKGTTSREWFEVDVAVAKNAIKAVKKGLLSLSPDKITDNHSPIVFRPEQAEAIKQTINVFKNSDKMLWNAKMRFGKTLSALEVAKQMKFKRTIIITHRPVVDSGWYNDFNNIFWNNKDEYIYGSKSLNITIDYLEKSDKNYVYFASMQDLRGSSTVGGKYKKNNLVFNLDWDFVVVDEAHEGTQTALGESVIKEIIKEQSEHKTKFLALSGTPFNIINDYGDKENIYTWDYVMEQRAKYEWDKEHFGDSNPYEELPELKIYTYDLGKVINSENYQELEDKAFNFKEFFRVWTGNSTLDRKELPNDVEIGDFYHKDDVLSFLNLITKTDDKSNYPYSNEEYRNLFKHSLWMVPGVKEARALSKMMKNHHIFGNGMFDIINVAGDGDEEDKSEEALKKVRSAIDNAVRLDRYTITLSCGKLTTGVTIPEWTAVMMLSGSYSTSASNYLQTIFRVQSPANINGKIKKSCYVFDFAPDRTLKMIADSVKLSSDKPGKTKEADRRIMGEFLNYCPVISVDGTVMRKYNENYLLQQLKKAYADRAVKNGFDDKNLYNDELLKLTEEDLKKFDKLNKIVDASKQSKKVSDITITNNGFTNEDYEEIEKIEKKPKRQRTPEEEEKLKEINKRRELRDKAISNLRAISIRIPLLIYGTDINFDENFDINKFADSIDDLSWAEFMPKGIDKELFKEFSKYYDMDVFIAAGRKIHNIVKSADRLSPTERTQKIAKLFSGFKNPDKETVLTPWRVVNMHMGDCLGGYNFYDKDYEIMLEIPRYIDCGKVTSDTLRNKNSKILEINSKTGLYTLYAAYSIYRSKCEDYLKEDLYNELKEKLWYETVEQNIFVICKTPMAQAITKRTLVGFKDINVHTRHFEDLINQLKNKSKQFIDKISDPKTWKLKGVSKMEFNAIVGNPPYQQMDGGNGASSSPVYNYFIEQSKKFNAKYLSMIIPARWYVGGKGLDNFRWEMLNDKRIRKLIDYGNSQDVFKGVDIAGGVCYFLWDSEYDGLCEVKNCSKRGEEVSNRYLNEYIQYNIFIRDGKAIKIINKVIDINKNNKYLSDRVSSRKPFGLPTNYKPKNEGIPCWFIQKIGLKYAMKNDITDSNNYLDKWKLLAPKAPIAGQTDFTKPVGFYYNGNTKIAKPGECCTESYIILGAFDTEREVISFRSYIFTKIVRFLLLQTVASQDVTKKNFCFIPDLENYEHTYTDEELRKIWNITDEEWEYIDSKICNVGN